MKKTILSAVLSIMLFMFMSCGQPEQNTKKDPENVDETKEFDILAVKKIIQENDRQWGIGLQKKDISIISNLYDENAHYIPNADNALHGNKEITEYWKPAIGMIERLELDMETLEGTKDILYETGVGTSWIKASNGKVEKYKYKYVNVWKLQKDGTYKVVIDTYNDLKPNNNK
jgi:ketosteroid isomerase-like protein